MMTEDNHGPNGGVLKETTSLCPQCYREIAAHTRLDEQGGVVMEKHCPDHGPFRAQIEADAEVYQAFLNRGATPVEPNILLIPVTHRCNLRCRMCYLPDSDREEISWKALTRIIDAWPGAVGFTGGEPTLRADLPELITYAAQHDKHPWLITNGLRLAEPGLAARLVDAGLTAVLFSLNGLSDAVFAQIEGQPLLARKMAGLEALLATRVRPVLSTTVVTGVNEGEVPRLLDLCLKNAGGFGGWRIRAQAAIGRHTEAPGLFLSGMLHLVCSALGIDRAELLARIDTERQPYQRNAHAYLSALSTVGPRRRTVGFRTVTSTPGVSGGHGLLRGLPPSEAALAAIYRLFRPDALKWLEFDIFAWHDAHNVDLQDVRQSSVYHVGPGGRPLAAIEALLLNDGQPDWDWG